MKLFKFYFQLAVIAALLPMFTVSAQDDVYYTPSNSSTTTDGSGNTYITNNYYGDNNNEDYVYYEDDEYDYYYTSRIRRFNNPYNGFGYYSGCYTDRYWYSPNPHNWGYSIYNDPFFNPYAGPAFSMSWGWGNMIYRPWGWNRWNTWNRWNNPWAHQHHFNSFYHNAYVNSFYAPNPYSPTTVYVYNDYNYSNNTYTESVNSNTHYGPRTDRSGYGSGSSYGDRPEYATGSGANSNDDGTGKQGDRGNATNAWSNQGVSPNSTYNTPSASPTPTYDNTGIPRPPAYDEKSRTNKSDIYSGQQVGKPNTNTYDHNKPTTKPAHTDTYIKKDTYYQPKPAMTTPTYDTKKDNDSRIKVAPQYKSDDSKKGNKYQQKPSYNSKYKNNSNKGGSKSKSYNNYKNDSSKSKSYSSPSKSKGSSYNRSNSGSSSSKGRSNNSRGNNSSRRSPR